MGKIAEKSFLLFLSLLASIAIGMGIGGYSIDPLQSPSNNNSNPKDTSMDVKSASAAAPIKFASLAKPTSSPKPTIATTPTQPPSPTPQKHEVTHENTTTSPIETIDQVAPSTLTPTPEVLISLTPTIQPGQEDERSEEKEEKPKNGNGRSHTSDPKIPDGENGSSQKPEKNTEL